MIITCINCNKKFNIDAYLIPENGRLLECSSCKHQWFFKNEVMKNIINPSNIEAISKIGTTQISNEKQKNDLGNNETLEKTKITNNKKNVDNILDDNSIEDVKKNKKKPRIIKLILILLITFIALIILLDTFKNVVSKLIPNIELILYNLYESIKDVMSFFKDLIL